MLLRRRLRDAATHAQPDAVPARQTLGRNLVSVFERAIGPRRERERARAIDLEYPIALVDRRSQIVDEELVGPGLPGETRRRQ